MNLKSKIYVKISTPVHIIYEGDAKGVSAQSAIGPFDILQDHRNFISLLKAGTIKVLTLQDESKEFPITKGILKVSDNKVYIFANI